MTFGHALEALKAGCKVARAGWNGKSMWIALSKGYSFPAAAASPGHASKLRADEVKGTPAAEVIVLSHIDMRSADGSMVIGWLASQTDMLAEDWMIVE
nr:DUF2829 domain-containing protein [uncultured Cohaesibacter sp.]